MTDKSANYRARKILYFDIESTDLRADFGECVVFGYAWNDEPVVHTLSLLDYPGWEDKPVHRRDEDLLRDVYKIMLEADVIVGHYSKRFDYRFLQTRCLILGLPILPPIYHVDTWEIAKRALKFTSNRMAALAEYLGLSIQKGSMPKEVWRALKAHDPDAIAEACDYCAQDVEVTRELARRLFPVWNRLPSRQLMENSEVPSCHNCGSTNITHRGWRYTNVHKYRRLRCNDCGKWMRGRKTVVDPNVERHTQ